MILDDIVSLIKSISGTDNACIALPTNEWGDLQVCIFTSLARGNRANSFKTLEMKIDVYSKNYSEGLLVAQAINDHKILTSNPREVGTTEFQSYYARDDVDYTVNDTLAEIAEFGLYYYFPIQIGCVYQGL